MKEVGIRIKAARERAGMSQADVAKRLDLTPQGYAFFERGSRTIALHYILQLPAILNCSIADLLPSTVLRKDDRERLDDPELRALLDVWFNLTEDQRPALVVALEALTNMGRRNQPE